MGSLSGVNVGVAIGFVVPFNVNFVIVGAAAVTAQCFERERFTLRYTFHVARALGRSKSLFCQSASPLCAGLKRASRDFLFGLLACGLAMLNSLTVVGLLARFKPF